MLNLLRRALVPVTCPACRHTFKPMADREFTHWRELFARQPCPKCGHRFGFDEDAKSLIENPPGLFKKPKGSRIERLQPSPDEVIYHLPCGRQGMVLIVCTVFWNLFILPLFYFTVVKGGGFAPDVIAPRVIISVMAVVGLGALFGGLRQRFTSYLLYLGPEVVRLQSRFILPWNKDLPTRAIESVQRVEAYTTQSGSEYSPVIHVTYTIELRVGFRPVRFGSGLEEAEQLWLASEIREYLRAHGAADLPAEIPTRAKTRPN